MKEWDELIKKALSTYIDGLEKNNEKLRHELTELIRAPLPKPFFHGKMMDQNCLKAERQSKRFRCRPAASQYAMFPKVSPNR